MADHPPGPVHRCAQRLLERRIGSRSGVVGSMLSVRRRSIRVPSRSIVRPQVVDRAGPPPTSCKTICSRLPRRPASANDRLERPCSTRRIGRVVKLPPSPRRREHGARLRSSRSVRRRPAEADRKSLDRGARVAISAQREREVFWPWSNPDPPRPRLQPASRDSSAARVAVGRAYLGVSGARRARVRRFARPRVVRLRRRSRMSSRARQPLSRRWVRHYSETRDRR